MPWQRLALDVALELDEDGSYFYDELVLTVPRQSGKTTLMLALAVHRLVVAQEALGRQRVTYLAAHRAKARLKLERDFAETLRAAAGYIEVAHAKARPRSSTEWRLSLNNGSEAILFGAGNYLQIDAPSRTAVHGDTLDLGLIDEAFAHEDDIVEVGMEPSMATRRNHQLIVISTAGDVRSRYLWRKVLAGRKASEAGHHGRTAYFEWSAPDDADSGDPEVWAACSPALGITIEPRFLEGQWDKAQRGGRAGVDKFRRSYLNQWPEVPMLNDEAMFRVIPSEVWARCEDPLHKPGERLVYALELDTNAKGEEWCSIAASDGTHLEDVTPLDAGPGTGWVLPRVLAARDRITQLLVDPAGPASKLIGPLENAGIDVRTLKSTEITQACMYLADRCNETAVRHLGQPRLTRAVAGVVRRDVGDGSFRFSRKASAVDISPLLAVAMACWAAQEIEQPSTYESRGLIVL